MSDGRDNPAFNTEIPMKDFRGQKELREAQVDLKDDSHTPNHLAPSSNGDVYKEGNEEEEWDDSIPKPKVFRPEDHNMLTRSLMKFQTILVDLYYKNKVWIWRVIGIVVLILFFVYFCLAMKHEKLDGEAAWRLMICTAIGVLLLVWNICLRVFGDQLNPALNVIHDLFRKPEYSQFRKVIRWLLYIASTVGVVTILIVVVALEDPENLLSLAGLAAFIVICFVTSYSPAMVDWHAVFWGFSIQFYFAVIILKTDWGYESFKWLGDRITEFLAYSDAGARFVFGGFATITPVDGSKPISFTDPYLLHFFAFALMPVVTFFSTIISVLYYLGVMQSIVKVIGHFLSFCLGTTPAESLNAAGNIFVAMTESPLMIRPFIPTMTRSELHAVMTGGFATIAGSVLGAYIGFGVPADHLLSASVMSAPAALAISKLTYPEIDEPVIKDGDYDRIEKTTEGNVIEAACNGAIMSAKIIASILVNVIAFLSLLAFINATLVWFGERVGKHGFNFEYICSYVLYPVALFMGTKPKDCRKVAELIGVKVFTNEFIAYSKLAVILNNRKALREYEDNYGDDWTSDGDTFILPQTNTTLENGILSERSEIIATYALCGFANFGSMGIMIGALSSMAPKRRKAMSRLVLRAMIAGNVACFFTACIAGLFFESRD